MPPPEQVPDVIVQVRVPKWVGRHRTVVPDSRHIVQNLEVHAAPGGTVHACVCIVPIDPEHTPPAQLAVVHVRVWVPCVSQVSVVFGTQEPNAPQVGIPHGLPSVDPIVHARLSVVEIAMHEPAWHVGVVTIRDSRPSVLHDAPTTHGPYGSIVTVPQADPSVAPRVHAIDSVVVEGAQVPAAQVEAVTLRVIVPAVVQASRNTHADQSSSAIGAHVTPSVVRSHASLSGAVVASQAPELHA